MKPLNILVTAVGGDLAQSVIKCLKDSPYETVIIGCDMNPYAGGRALCDRFLTAPPVKDTEAYRTFLTDTVKNHGIDYVFPLSDVEITFLNDHREWLEGSTAAWVMNEQTIIDRFMDKYETVEFFKAHGLPYPVTYLPENYNGQLGFPVILKRRSGSGGRDLFKVYDAEALDFYLGRHEGMIIQEYLPGDDNEYTAGMFSDGTAVHTITFKRTLAPGGFSQQAELVTDGAAAEFPRLLARVLPFKGSINVQFRETAKGCVAFEINPRFSSTVYLRHVFGFRDVAWALDAAMGKAVNYTPVYKRGVAVRRFSEAFFELEK